MNDQQLIHFNKWFDAYVASYYGDDDYVNANLKLKEDHSRRVCDEMDYLAEQLDLPDNHRRTAHAIALLHDIARFPQFAEHRTYHDPRSINHCTLAVQILTENKILRPLAPTEREIILKAVEFHGAKEIPAGLDADTLLFCKLIRDADKLDIYRVMIENYRLHRDDPDSFYLEVELPDDPYYSPQVIDDILSERNVDYTRLKTWNDMKLINLAWIYDVNFIPTLKRIKQKRFLEQVLEFLPDTEDIRKIRQKVFACVDSRIAQGK